MDCLPRKSLSNGVSKKKKTYKLSTNVKSILSRKYDKWTVNKAYERLKHNYERLKHNLNTSRSLMRIILLLFKGDLKKYMNNLVKLSQTAI